MTIFLLLSDSCWFVDVGHSLWWEDGYVVQNCCWSSPAQSFLGPSPVGLATIFYSLKFETSLFVDSYDSQREPYRGHPLQQFVCCNLHICCHSNPCIHSQVAEVLLLTVLGMCLPSSGSLCWLCIPGIVFTDHWLTMNVCSDFTILAFRHHVTIYFDSALVVSESNLKFQVLYVLSIRTRYNFLFTCKD
jgi:hypothetical protein